MVPEHPFNEMKPNSGIGEVLSERTSRKNVSKQSHDRRGIAVASPRLPMDHASSISLRVL
jgi:hypothetical protein